MEKEQGNCGAGIIHEYDLVWDRPEGPRYVVAVEYPALDSFLDYAVMMVRQRLRSSAMREKVLDYVVERMAEAAALEAIGMHKALWRDLLPRVGVSGVLFTQLALDLGPAGLVSPGGTTSKSLVDLWNPIGPNRRVVQRYGIGRPPPDECILDVQEIREAYLLNQSSTCLCRFVKLIKFINMVTNEIVIVLGANKVNRYWIAEATALVMLVQKVSATAMYLAIWKGLYQPPAPRGGLDQPTLF